MRRGVVHRVGATDRAEAPQLVLDRLVGCDIGFVVESGIEPLFRRVRLRDALFGQTGWRYR